jgi:hypothetical protein
MGSIKKENAFIVLNRRHAFLKLLIENKTSSNQREKYCRQLLGLQCVT